MKYLYIVDYWVPYPASDGGGILNVIAENDDECFTLLSPENFQEYNEEYANLIMPKVKSATKFELANSEEESRIVDAFLT
jgi:hypothetical protein